MRNREITEKRDRKVISEYCRILSIKQWMYQQTPTEMFRMWEDHLHGKNRDYLRNHCNNPHQAECMMKMFSFIHYLYLKVSERNVQQLEIFK